MSKANGFENDVLEITFNQTLAAHLGTLSGTGNANLFVALHTADPGENPASGQQTSECAYGAYARVGVTRASDGSGWTVSGNQVQNTAVINFPECTSGSETVTHFSIGTVTSGAGQILYKGALTASRNVSSGITLQFPATSITITED
jgi:hypothetical protein